jgi:hypothetical protein
MLENDIKENFFIPTDGGATPMEVFNIIKHFLQDNKINWKKCTGL